MKKEGIIKKAELFAVKAHGEQKYGEHPYRKHLADVADVVGEHLGLDPFLSAAAWLHDTLEDTDVTFENLFYEFGSNIARIVYAVTDEPGKNRKERHEKTYPKILAAGWEATAVKLADRIANTRNCLKYNHNLFKMYKKEYEEFKKKLCIPGELKSMWAELDVLMAEKIED